MKIRYILLRSVSLLLMLVLTSVSAALALIMFGSIHIPGITFHFPWLVLGDELIPLALFLLALCFHSRFFTIAAIITSFVNIFLRLASIIVFKETYMPLDYFSVKMLLEHFDHYSLKAVLGAHYYLWLCPAVLLAVGAMICCCVLAWKTSGKYPRKISRLVITVFLVLVLLSGFSNLLFHLTALRTPEHYMPVRPLPIVSVEFANGTIHDFSVKEDKDAGIPIPPESLELLSEYQIIPPPHAEKKAPDRVFDRIIIVAVESLDHDFIRANNPRMPAGITPNLDRLTRQYPSMKNYFTAAQPTSWGLTAMLMSRLDYEQERKRDNESLFSIAAEHGYRSIYFSAASGSFGDNRRLYRDLFRPDRQFFLEEWKKLRKFEQETAWGISDATLFRGVYEELRKLAGQKFIAVISTMDTHPPYFTGKEEAEKGKKAGTKTAGSGGRTVKSKPPFDSPFLRALHQTDRQIGRFVDAVTGDRELFDRRTLLIITADHSATHGENYLHRENFSPAKIPLIFICPDPTVFGKIDTGKFASAIDLAPTLVGLIGAKCPESFMGRELASGKNIAISRIFGDILILHGPEYEKPLIVNCQPPPENLPERAISDFYRRHYGKSK